jgi:carboxypeptidase family protein
MSTLLRRLVIVLIVSVCFLAEAKAQTGMVRGTVLDTSGKPLQGAVVTLRGPSGTTYNAKTDTQGQFRHDQLPSGAYTITIALQGFIAQTRPISVAGTGEEIAAFVLETDKSQSAKPSATSSPDTQATASLKKARFWGGLGQYSMRSFNEKLRAESNEPLGDRENYGGEGDVVAVRVPVIGGSVKLPLGFEILRASSHTVHSEPVSSTTVTWNLPASGFFVGPIFAFNFRQNVSGRPSSTDWLYVHPAVGYYFVGRFGMPAGLTVSDRQGRLNVKGSAPGWFVAVGSQPAVNDKLALFGEAGFRHLKFTDLRVEPEGSFPETVAGSAVRAGSLSEPLDYSGGLIRFGFTLGF